MAANKSQGSFYGLFLAAATVLCAGFYFYSTGMGKLLLIVGVAGLAGSLFGMLSIKSREGRTPLKPSSGVMKLAGAGVCLLGWLITVFGIHVTEGAGGRIILALAGIAVSLFGMLVILPGAFNKNAVWKR